MKGPFSSTPVARAVPFESVPNVLPETDVQTALEKAALFGSYYQHVASDPTDSTTSTTVWSIKVILTPAVALPLGTYALAYNLVGFTAGANREFDIRVRQDTTTLFEVRESIIRTQGERTVAGLLTVAAISGTPTFTLEFKVGGTSTTASVRNASLTLWRVL